MADDTTQAGTSGEEELTIVEVDKLPEPGTQTEDEDKGAKPKETDTGAEDEGDDDGDARLGSDEDGDRSEDDGEKMSEAKRRRLAAKHRREVARRHQEERLRTLEEQNQLLMQKLGQVEGNTLMTQAERIRQEHAQALSDIREAERIEALAIEDNKGSDAVQARRIRDAAAAKAYQLEQQYNDVAGKLQPQPQQAPTVDPALVQHATAWSQANPWYKPGSNDEMSQLADQIDTDLVRSGSDPRSPEHWRTLTQRLNEMLSGGEDDAGGKAATQTGRKGPPTGGGREHAPQSTRNEILVTPERKQAMIDAGVWDDPVQRNRFLKSYRDYDRGTAR